MNFKVDVWAFYRPLLEHALQGWQSPHTIVILGGVTVFNDRGRFTFHGGLSVQSMLPRGTLDDVRQESKRLLDAGREGSYIFAPSHDMTWDVPLANMLALGDLTLMLT